MTSLIYLFSFVMYSRIGYMNIAEEKYRLFGNPYIDEVIKNRHILHFSTLCILSSYACI